MLEALSAAIVAASEIQSPHPRCNMRASSMVAANASSAPDNPATAANPRHRHMTAKHTSASHSQANQGWPGRVNENGSDTGTRPVLRTNSPVRICQPVSPSDSSPRAPCGNAKAAINSVAKNTSSSVGVINRRKRPGGAVDTSDIAHQIDWAREFLKWRTGTSTIAAKRGSH
jgi:hypothetical protein